MKRILLVISILAAVVISPLANESKQRFDKGAEYYRNGDFRTAADIWTDLYNSGYDNFELLYNLGNAWFKLEEIPLSVIFYERALLRRPMDDDARYNLSIAKTLTRDRYETIPEIFLIR